MGSLWVSRFVADFGIASLPALRVGLLVPLSVPGAYGLSVLRTVYNSAVDVCARGDLHDCWWRRVLFRCVVAWCSCRRRFRLRLLRLHGMLAEKPGSASWAVELPPAAPLAEGSLLMRCFLGGLRCSVPGYTPTVHGAGFCCFAVPGQNVTELYGAGGRRCQAQNETVIRLLWWSNRYTLMRSLRKRACSPCARWWCGALSCS